MRASFDYTFVDLGRTLSRLSFLLFTQADAIVFLVGPDEPSAENGRRILGFLKEEGVPPERVLVVLNRPIAGEQMSGQDLAHRLGRPVDTAIANAGSHFALANSLHTPFSLRFPEETASQALKDLATRVTERLRATGG
jgi:MinD-like ATPase involved in chromosome partitioning or flagellar assembly